MYVCFFVLMFGSIVQRGDVEDPRYSNERTKEDAKDMTLDSRENATSMVTLCTIATRINGTSR